MWIKKQGNLGLMCGRLGSGAEYERSGSWKTLKQKKAPSYTACDVLWAEKITVNINARQKIEASRSDVPCSVMWADLGQVSCAWSSYLLPNSLDSSCPSRQSLHSWYPHTLFLLQLFINIIINSHHSVALFLDVQGTVTRCIFCFSGFS